MPEIMYCVFKFYSFINLKIMFFSNLSQHKLSLLPALIVYNKLEVFTKQIAGTVMVFILVKLNESFTIKKRNTLRPLSIPQSLLTTSKVLDIINFNLIWASST